MQTGSSNSLKRLVNPLCCTLLWMFTKLTGVQSSGLAIEAKNTINNKWPFTVFCRLVFVAMSNILLHTYLFMLFTFLLYLSSKCQLPSRVITVDMCCIATSPYHILIMDLFDVRQFTSEKHSGSSVPLPKLSNCVYMNLVSIEIEYISHYESLTGNSELKCFYNYPKQSEK